VDAAIKEDKIEGANNLVSLVIHQN